MQRHFWYLTEEIAPFSLFSDSFTESEKCQIAWALRKVAPGEQLDQGVPIFPVLNTLARLVSLIDGKLLFLFNIIGVKMDWLEEPPSQWYKNSD